ncbi:MAG TPA: fumarylacetoacetate hydrolase family protein [Opitutus sp.]|nr:fumarylacetoacetate hydrolase family protein [Opitutus sp.]
MKLIRFGLPRQEKPGVILADGSWRDVSAFTSDYTEEFFGSDGPSRLARWLTDQTGVLPEIPRGTRLGSPIARPNKVICIGLNFVDHAKEAGMELPKEPILFFKATSAITGPNDGLVLPRGGDKTDWEVELAVVIGKRASYVSEAEALNHVAGYCLHNDYSERAFQLERCGQWVKGKSCDTFAPLGPFIATADELADVNALRMWLRVNGETKQESTTANLGFKVPHLISYISQFMTLEPGDVISTGTPPGVGMGFKPPQFLQAGDVVELGIDGLGEQKQTVFAAR